MPCARRCPLAHRCRGRHRRRCALPRQPRRCGCRTGRRVPSSASNPARTPSPSPCPCCSMFGCPTPWWSQERPLCVLNRENGFRRRKSRALRSCERCESKFGFFVSLKAVCEKGGTATSALNHGGPPPLAAALHLFRSSRTCPVPRASGDLAAKIRPRLRIRRLRRARSESVSLRHSDCVFPSPPRPRGARSARSPQRRPPRRAARRKVG